MDNNTLKRYFIALNLPEKLKDDISVLIEKLKNDYPGIKWTSKECLHITMHFLGNLDVTQGEKIKVSLQSFDRKFNAIELMIDGLGAFPNLTHPRVIHLSCRQANGNFCIKLNELIGQKISQQGIKIDYRKWQPHITLGRVKDGENIVFDKGIYQRDYERFFVDSFDLMESVLDKKGPRYFLIEKYELLKQHESI